jgi:hypothetical protein
MGAVVPALTFPLSMWQSMVARLSRQSPVRDFVRRKLVLEEA